MNNLFIVYESWESKEGISIKSVCTSKRQAVKMATDAMLSGKKIKPEELAEAKKQLDKTPVTHGFSIEEIKPNTFLNLQF